MKNQYVGDVNDYRKYGLLRSLSDGGRCRLGVCWMLTGDDSRTDGRKVEYLSSPDKWREYDAELFDLLCQRVGTGDRRIEAIEQSRCLPGALFHSDLLTDDRERRISYFREAERRLSSANLVFFDPDNGLEVGSCRVGNKNSCKYLYWAELESFFHSGRSVIIFQHFIREKRTTFIQRLVSELETRLAPGAVFAFRTPHVLFLLASQPSHVDWFRRQIHSLRAHWPANQILTLMKPQGTTSSDLRELS